MKPPSWRTEQIGLASPMEEQEAAAQQEKGQRDEPDLRQSGDRGGLAKIVAGIGIGDLDAGAGLARDLTLHQDNRDAVLKTGWEMCELAKLPQEIQDNIRTTTMENVSQYKTANGYEFPDRIVVGVATK